jgi:hypothetical protein
MDGERVLYWRKWKFRYVLGWKNLKEKGQPKENKHKLENDIKIDLKGIRYNCCELD